MDVGAFVQENKRWLLGCAIGGLAFFIARGVISSVYDPETARGEARRAAQVGSVYDRAALQAAAAEGEQLQQALTQLRSELGFTPDPAYDFEGKGLSPDEFLGKVGRDRKIAILRAANERDVIVQEKDLSWPPAPQGRDEIRSVLFGIELVDAVSERLFAAHDLVKKQDPQAQGLVSMALRVDARKAQRSPLRAPKPGEVDVRDYLDQERVVVEFKADEAVVLAFLESLHHAGKALVVETPLKLVHPDRRGDPVTCTCTVGGIAFKKDASKKEPN